jgi:uncharacterized membrane protein YqjE
MCFNFHSVVFRKRKSFTSPERANRINLCKSSAKLALGLTSCVLYILVNFKFVWKLQMCFSFHSVVFWKLKSSKISYFARANRMQLHKDMKIAHKILENTV